MTDGTTFIAEGAADARTYINSNGITVTATPQEWEASLKDMGFELVDEDEGSEVGEAPGNAEDLSGMVDDEDDGC